MPRLRALPVVMIRARALTGFADLVGQHGGDLNRLLARAGLAPAAIDQPEAVFPLDQLAELLDVAAAELELPDIGLRLAQLQDISVLGAVALIALNAETLGAALAVVSRYLPYHTPGARLDVLLEPGSDCASLFYDLSLAPGVTRRHAMELSYAVAWSFLRTTVADRTDGWSVHFRHDAGGSAAACRTAFGIPVHFGAARDALVFPAGVLACPIDPGNQALRHAAERMVRNTIRRHPLDIGGQVASLAERQLATGLCTRAHIARQLGLHERTLQRRLAAQGFVFEDIMDSLRRQRAAEYLAQPVIPLSEVAALLGYTEQSSFNRACLRWFSATPGAVRRHSPVP